MSLSHTDRHYISKLYRHSVCYHTTTTTTRKTTSEIHLPDTVFDTVLVFRFKVQKGIESSLLSIPFLHSLPKKNITLLHYNITFLGYVKKVRGYVCGCTKTTDLLKDNETKKDYKS